MTRWVGIGAVLVLGLVGCARTQAAQCAFNSECSTDLICVAGVCRSECLTDRDCAEGEQCAMRAGSRVCLPPSPDAGLSTDLGPLDAGPLDAGLLDAGLLDASEGLDAGSADAGPNSPPDSAPPPTDLGGPRDLGQDAAQAPDAGSAPACGDGRPSDARDLVGRVVSLSSAMQSALGVASGADLLLLRNDLALPAQSGDVIDVAIAEALEPQRVIVAVARATRVDLYGVDVRTGEITTGPVVLWSPQPTSFRAVAMRRVDRDRVGLVALGSAADATVFGWSCEGTVLDGFRCGALRAETGAVAASIHSVAITGEGAGAAIALGGGAVPGARFGFTPLTTSSVTVASLTRTDDFFALRRRLQGTLGDAVLAHPAGRNDVFAISPSGGAGVLGQLVSSASTDLSRGGVPYGGGAAAIHLGGRSYRLIQAAIDSSTVFDLQALDADVQLAGPQCGGGACGMDIRLANRVVAADLAGRPLSVEAGVLGRAHVVVLGVEPSTNAGTRIEVRALSDGAAHTVIPVLEGGDSLLVGSGVSTDLGSTCRGTLRDVRTVFFDTGDALAAVNAALVVLDGCSPPTTTVFVSGFVACRAP